MKKENKRTLTPRLRFPEFRKAQEWETERMEKLYSFVRNNSISRDQLSYERGSVKNIHYGDIHTKFQSRFDITKERVPFVNETEALPPADSEDYCVEGDLIFADASEDTNDVGKSIELVNLNGERLLSGQHTILARRRNGRIALGFGGYLFRSRSIRAQIEKEAQGTKVYAISATRLGNVNITFPSTHPEQRKIAACLGSLDDWIEAESRKLEALRSHKKGLMQQLFPRPGETRPRLRFPEFRKEWVETRLEELCISISSGRDQSDPDGPYDLYGSTGIIGKTATSSFSSPHLLVARVGANAGLLTMADGQFGVTDNTLVVSPNASTNLTYIFYYLGNININRLIFGSGQPLITGSILRNLAVFLPAESEQAKISDCLSALDEVIHAQGNKLEALKIHKKGLMQQLFPSPEEVET